MGILFFIYKIKKVLSTARIFGHNPNRYIVNEANLYGDVSVATGEHPDSSITGITWYNGPDENLGYIISSPRPDIVQKGLVLNLDASNDYSFRGEPTTNLVLYSENFESWSVQNTASVNTGTTLNPFGILNASTFNVSTSIYSCIYRVMGRGVEITTNSIYAKRGSLNYLYLLGSNGGGGSGAFFNLLDGVVGTVVAGYTASIENVGNDWYRCICTNPSSTNAYFQIGASSVDNDQSSPISGYVYIWGAQNEIKSYATPYVKSTSTVGVRGTTVATGGGWEDLSGNSNNGELVNGPTYSSVNKGSLVFDGVDDYINTQFTEIVTGLTIECWFLGTKTSRNHLWNFGNSADNTNLSCDFNDGYDLWIYWNGSGGNRVRYNITSSFTDSTIKCLVFTHTSSTNKTFLNGVELTITESGGTQTFNNINGTYSFKIGDLIYFQGNIYVVRLYNRSLSSGEILQNFNATKYKFGFDNIVTSGLVLNLDAGNINSFQTYPTTGTTFYDLSGNGNNGTLISGVTYSGVSYGCLSFDGVNDHVRIPHNNTLTIDKTSTIDFWIYRNGVNAGLYEGIVSKRITGGGSTANYQIYLDSTTKKLGFYNGSTASVINFIPSLNTWYYITSIIKSTSVDYYVNSVYSGSTTNGYGASNSYDVTIGTDTAYYAEFFNGKISAVKIYNRALTQDEITQNYNTSKYRFGL